MSYHEALPAGQTPAGSGTSSGGRSGGRSGSKLNVVRGGRMLVPTGPVACERHSYLILRSLLDTGLRRRRAASHQAAKGVAE